MTPTLRPVERTASSCRPLILKVLFGAQKGIAPGVALLLAALAVVTGLTGCTGISSASKSNPNNSSAGALSASATNLNFGSVAEGSKSSQTLTLSNTGAATVTISQAKVTGAPFSVIGGMTSPLTIAAGQSHALQIQFAPSALGNVAGNIDVTSDASDPSLMISLNGTGTSAGATALLTPDTTNLLFGNVNLGSSSTLGVTFSNSGNSSVTVSNVTLTGAGFSATGMSGGEIVAPGATATLNVTFAPAAILGVTGSVTVTSNATNSPATISLAGTGIAAAAHSAVLGWTASTSSVSGYNVYRATVSGGPYTKINSALVTATTDTDSTVLAGLTYFYVVTAVDSSNVESAYSNEVAAVIP